MKPLAVALAVAALLGRGPQMAMGPVPAVDVKTMVCSTGIPLRVGSVVSSG